MQQLIQYVKRQNHKPQATSHKQHNTNTNTKSKDQELLLDFLQSCNLQEQSAFVT